MRCRFCSIGVAALRSMALPKNETRAFMGHEPRENENDAPCEKQRPCACRHKETERTEAFQADLHKRLNRVIGQLNGVKSMIDDNRYCGDVLVQLAASEAAVRRISEIILQDHMETCVVEQIREGNVGVVDEAMKLIKKFM